MLRDTTDILNDILDEESRPLLKKIDSNQLPTSRKTPLSSLDFADQADIWLARLKDDTNYSYRKNILLCNRTFNTSASRILMLALTGSVFAAVDIWLYVISHRANFLSAISKYNHSRISPNSTATCGEVFALPKVIDKSEFYSKFNDYSNATGFKRCANRSDHYTFFEDIMVLPVTILGTIAITFALAAIWYSMSLWFALANKELGYMTTISDLQHTLRKELLVWMSDNNIYADNETATYKVITAISEKKRYFSSSHYKNAMLKVISEEKNNKASYFYPFFNNRTPDGRQTKIIGDGKNIADLICAYSNILPDKTRAEVIDNHLNNRHNINKICISQTYSINADETEEERSASIAAAARYV